MRPFANDINIGITVGAYMRKLSFTHKKELQFDTPVISHSFSLRLAPQTNSRQIICDVRKDINPAEHLTEVTDEWGAPMCIGDCYSEHLSFCYCVSGIAWVRPTPFIEGPVHPVYRYASELTHPGPAINQLFSAADIRQAEPLERAKAWMQLVHRTVTYEKGATTVQTTAEQVAEQQKGVCQDFAHLMIALCRRDGIPARYVVGYLFGEGETHAWVETFDGKRWCGFDPTNNCLIDDGYICLTTGRDYNDCILDKGFFRTPGFASCTVTQTQYVSVTVYDAT